MVSSAYNSEWFIEKNDDYNECQKTMQWCPKNKSVKMSQPYTKTKLSVKSTGAKNGYK